MFKTKILPVLVGNLAQKLRWKRCLKVVEINLTTFHSVNNVENYLLNVEKYVQNISVVLWINMHTLIFVLCLYAY